MLMYTLSVQTSLDSGCLQGVSATTAFVSDALNEAPFCTQERPDGAGDHQDPELFWLS